MRQTRQQLLKRQRQIYEDLRNLQKKLEKIMDKLGNGPFRQRFQAPTARRQATVASDSTSSPCDLRGVLNMRKNFGKNQVPVFNSYEEFHKTVLQSFESISIVLNIDGKIVFISQNVSPLLGHRPEDIVGKTLLNILLDEEKEEISQKVVLNIPLAMPVGSLIEFCCYVRKGHAGREAQDTYDYRDIYEVRDTYEYVKFILYLQDSYDESFVYFGNYGPNSRKIQSSTPTQLWDQQYYLVGTISVLSTKAESEHPVEIPPTVTVIESDDDTDIQHSRLRKRRKRKRIQRNRKAKYLKTKHPVSVNEVEIIDIKPATRQIPFDLVQIRPPSQSSTCTIISLDSSMSPTTSISSIEFSAASFSPASAFGQGSMIDPRYLQDPVDIEFEVSPEFLVNDNQEEQASPEQGEQSDENMKKTLEEATDPNPKEHVIREVSGPSVEDSCGIVEEIEVDKGPKIQEPIVDQDQVHQKIVETATKCPSTVVRPVHPKALVEPRVCTDLPDSVFIKPRRPCQFRRPLLGERFAQLCGPQERKREQCEYELAQRIEMLRNLPNQRPMAQQQMGQRQENRVYWPRDQVVTVTNDLGRFPINSFGNDNSAYPRNETQRFCDDNANHTSPLLHCPLARSRQTTPMPRHPVTETYQSLAGTNHPSAAVSSHPSASSRHPLARSHLASSNPQRENGPHVIPRGQENSGYVQAEYNINPHP
ncbi:circadian clock protein PASD1-like [Onychomys torridus]|uniref:circadian clock protein PASD1-like n=1 Tax=Onychomys torridus TaxID=38674 RepID=UPI00167F49ED|nr:circadian clock protein PASD1-like [Onychomys torridus]